MHYINLIAGMLRYPGRPLMLSAGMSGQLSAEAREFEHESTTPSPLVVASRQDSANTSRRHSVAQLSDLRHGDRLTYTRRHQPRSSGD